MRHICSFFFFIMVSASAFAQPEYPRAEVFGGYSYLHIGTLGVTGSTLDSLCEQFLGAGNCQGTFRIDNGFSGWNAAAQVNTNRWLGIKADLSGHYGTPINLSADAITLLNGLGVTGLPPKANSFSYMFGPVVSRRSSRYTFFGHALFGANRAGVNLHVKVNQFEIPAFAISNTALAMAFGGGVDVGIARRFAIRGQADYLYTGHDFTSLIPVIASHQNNLRASAGIVYRFGGVENVSAESPQSAPRAAGPGMKVPALGITINLGSNPGAEIADEIRNGPAALAGLHPGDVINAVDGKAVKNPMDLAAELSSRTSGDRVRLGYLHGGMWQTEIVVILGSQ